VVLNYEDQLQAPPGTPIITQPLEEVALAMPQVAFLGENDSQPPGNQPPLVPPPGDPAPYLGLDTALKSLGHMLYSKESISAELEIQNSINLADPASRAAFWEFVTNVQQL
jgi:hypothetical protein